MSEPETKPGPIPRIAPPTTQTPEVVSKLIRFALSQLSADNAHHDFEHLCRHLARRRICSNILPATGPVSGGGDKGADFETVHVQSGFGTSQYWRLVASGNVLFACSIAKNLKKKVKADVEAAAKFGKPLERMYFFYNLPIKIGDRNKFKKAALEEHGIELEIIDGNAIAEFLADSELLWIAEEYLSLPSEVSLPSHTAAPPWYSSLLTTAESDLPTNSDTFYQLKSAIRYASSNPERHSEVPVLIRRLQRFRSHPDRVIARKAFYEEFVAALRGLNAAEGYEAQVIDYLSAIPSIDSPPELEDASIILSYVSGACNRGILHIETSIRRQFNDALLTKLNSLITPIPTFVTCSLLFTKGHVLLLSAALDDVTDDPHTFPLARTMEDAITVWEILLKHSRKIILFPVERLRPMVNFIFPHVKSESFAAFVRKLDGITSERAGAQSLAEQFVERASALLDAEDYLRAIEEFHEALRLSHNLESQSSAITVCLQLSALYQHIGLFHAAKYYALAAAFAALHLPEDNLRRLAAVGLAQASEADYSSGASLLFFLTSRTFNVVANEFAMAGKISFKEEQCSKVGFYALLLTRVAKVIGPDCHGRCTELLRHLDAQDLYAESKDKLDEMFADVDRSAVSARYHKEGIATPFSDYSPVRVTAWKQFGITWRVEWPSTYDSERHGEAFCSVLQIVLTALTGTEVSVIASEVTISLNTKHNGEEKIEQVADNDVLRFSVPVDPAIGMPFEEQIAVAYYVLVTSSAIPADAFRARFEEEFKRGLPQRIGVYIPPAEVFREFYSQRDYEELHGADPVEKVEPQPTPTWQGIAETSKVHPEFDESKALQLIRNRYNRSVEMFPHTIRQLASDVAFQQLASKLRQAGWKDWHIFLAVGNVRLNYLVDANSPNHKELMQAAMRNGEQPEDCLTPASHYNEERLRTSLQMSQLSTLTSMGFRVSQMTPNFGGVDAFLRRFKYWDLDVPHADPFGPSIQR